MQSVNILILKIVTNYNSFEFKVIFPCIKNHQKEAPSLCKLIANKLGNVAEYIHTICQKHILA